MAQLAGWSAELPEAEADPHRQRPLADRADGALAPPGPCRSSTTSTASRSATTTSQYAAPGRARAGGHGQVPHARHRARHRPRDPRPRPRRLGAADGDVPGRGHPGPPGVDAGPRPGAPVRHRPAAGPAARRGHADRRVRVHDPRAAVHRRVLRGQAGRAGSGRSSSTAGRPRRSTAATSTRCSRSARRRPGCRTRTRRWSTSRRCS